MASSLFRLTNQPTNTDPLKIVFVLLILVSAAIPAHANIREGLVGWWKLDETSGTTAIDWSGQNNNPGFCNRT